MSKPKKVGGGGGGGGVEFEACIRWMQLLCLDVEVCTTPYPFVKMQLLNCRK